MSRFCCTIFMFCFYWFFCINVRVLTMLAASIDVFAFLAACNELTLILCFSCFILLLFVANKFLLLSSSTLAIWCRVCPVSRCQPPQFQWSGDVRSRVFSRPDRVASECKPGSPIPGLGRRGFRGMTSVGSDVLIARQAILLYKTDWQSRVACTSHQATLTT